jgi:hypothetical protein
VSSSNSSGNDNSSNEQLQRQAFQLLWLGLVVTTASERVLADAHWLD